MKIALAQINPIVGDIKFNLDKILDYANQAEKKQVDLIIYPELAICGYPPGDLLLKQSYIDANLKALEKIKTNLRNLAAIVGFADPNFERGRPLFNACAFIRNGVTETKQYKTLLPTYDVFDEDRYFQSASDYKCAHLAKYKLGLTICEDAWSADVPPHGIHVHGLDSRYMSDPIAQVAAMKPTFIINISASPFAIGKHQLRENLLAAHARKHGIPIFFVNQVGGNDELIFDGRSFVVNKDGDIVASASAFSEDLLIVEINEADDSLSGEIRPTKNQQIWETYQALILGTRDYVHKCGYKDVVLGLSGGIDSAVVSAIACKALGAEHVSAISMPSPYSSPGSITDSQKLAQNLNMQLEIIPIEPAITAFDHMLARPFAEKNKDVTEENIQARMRAAVLMAFSNKFKRLLLTTGNKSELAVGYCTLYGDMCGGLAMISDVPKMRVYELAEYINAEAGYDLIPRAIIEKAPSAELKPGQTDQDTLPPYPVLDAIINLYIEEGKSTQEIINAGHAPHIVKEIVSMITRNEFKRHQAAPGLKLTSRAFGMGWRMPIAQGFRETDI
jgi:NAD+ synthetase